jgi:hypothetical protein
MSLRRRCAAICGVLALAALAACSESPNEPSRLPTTVVMVTGQTTTVPGTDVELRLEALGPCPPNASCLAGPRARLTARIGGRAPVDVFLAYNFEGPPVPQVIDGYSVALRSFTEEVDGRVRVVLIVHREPQSAS